MKFIFFLILFTISSSNATLSSLDEKAKDWNAFFADVTAKSISSRVPADIVPITLLHIDHLLKGMKSCIVNTVHDSIVIDIHPKEENDVLNIIKRTNNELTEIVNTTFKLKLNVYINTSTNKINGIKKMVFTFKKFFKFKRLFIVL